ncbi:RNA-binding protein 34 [Tribolium madens]|uniref:RNA-binding protein 34 n=1 Tax=Tribolium madens TaxID=41895 RepID=UPI001CF71ED1|nr:RNA-binding protein 34 [Tribolium madens]
MDYSVGSLSDLITGSNTPNKKNVIRKKISPKTRESNKHSSSFASQEPDETSDFQFQEQKSEKTLKKKIKKKATKKLMKPNLQANDENESLDFQEQKSENKLKKKKKIKENNTEKSVKRELQINDENEFLDFQEHKSEKKLKKKIKENNEEKPVKREGQTSDEDGPLVKKSRKSMNAERRIKSKEKKEKFEEDPELLSRTIFVGNLPINSNTIQLKRFFMKYGKVEAVWIRGVPVADPKISKKVAIIKKKFHPDRKSFHGYVRFETRDEAIKSTEADGVLYKEHHLRVNMSDAKDKPDENKAIFIGNLSFYAEEDDLWKTFESCGPISSVRIVRDKKTGVGKGFGYVNFKNSDSVTLALEMENVKLKDRELRISLCNLNAAKKNKKTGKVKEIKKAGKPRTNKNKEKSNVEQNDVKEEVHVIGNQAFQGVKHAEKKKKKFNKGLLQKKKLVKQIAPK